MDWMTLTITSIGAVIFCLWVIIPIREYRVIYRRLRGRGENFGGETPTPTVPRRTGGGGSQQRRGGDERP
jgi:hypothetical protein